MYRSPFNGSARQTTAFKKPGKWAAGYHTGEDWVCDSDRTLVAPASGIVTRNGYDENGYGNYIVILTNQNHSVLMGHMVKKSNKKTGDNVYAGEVVGTMGNTGNSTGTHLHIEIENTTVWEYNKNLLKPSDFIDFNNFNYMETEDFEVAKVWTNGSTAENVFAETTLATKIGVLNPRESCDCLGIVNGMYIVKYKVDGTDTFKVGFVKYSGGIV